MLVQSENSLPDIFIRLFEFLSDWIAPRVGFRSIWTLQRLKIDVGNSAESCRTLSISITQHSIRNQKSKADMLSVMDSEHSLFFDKQADMAAKFAELIGWGVKNSPFFSRTSWNFAKIWYNNIDRLWFQMTASRKLERSFFGHRVKTTWSKRRTSLPNYIN